MTARAPLARILRRIRMRFADAPTDVAVSTWPVLARLEEAIAQALAEELDSVEPPIVATRGESLAYQALEEVKPGEIYVHPAPLISTSCATREFALGDHVIVYNRYCFAVPVKGVVIGFAEGDGALQIEFNEDNPGGPNVNKFDGKFFFREECRRP